MRDREEVGGGSLCVGRAAVAADKVSGGEIRAEGCGRTLAFTLVSQEHGRGSRGTDLALLPLAARGGRIMA